MKDTDEIDKKQDKWLPRLGGFSALISKVNPQEILFPGGNDPEEKVSH